jgi:hypothetical protein
VTRPETPELAESGPYSVQSSAGWRTIATRKRAVRDGRVRDGTPTGPMAVWTAPHMQEGRLAPALTWGFSGADDGIRTRDPHLGNRMAYVSYISTSLTSASELHVLVALVSSVSPDRWSRLDFVGVFVGGMVR